MNLTTSEASARLGVPAATLRWWRHRGEGPPSFRLGGRVFYRSEDLEEWEQEQYEATLVGGEAPSRPPRDGPSRPGVPRLGRSAG
ncbi:helix-turn-helix domain-containing protein [Knoellia locipacati]|nr:helix-turn-helix domain-containing protein [Knoellia locipacati]